MAIMKNVNPMAIAKPTSRPAQSTAAKVTSQITFEQKREREHAGWKDAQWPATQPQHLQTADKKKRLEMVIHVKVCWHIYSNPVLEVVANKDRERQFKSPDFLIASVIRKDRIISGVFLFMRNPAQELTGERGPMGSQTISFSGDMGSNNNN